jgi:hypothetical protein
VDDGHHQRLEPDVDGDAEVDAPVDDQLVVADAGVEVTELAERVDGCSRNEGEEAEAGRRRTGSTPW